MSSERLSIHKIRQLLPDNQEYTDEFLLKLRGELYELADLALDCFFEKKKSSKGYPL